VADFTTGPGNDHDGFAHQKKYTLRIDQRIARAVAPRQSAAPMK
jgi:hypothetical protein